MSTTHKDEKLPIEVRDCQINTPNLLKYRGSLSQQTFKHWLLCDWSNIQWWTAQLCSLKCGKYRVSVFMFHYLLRHFFMLLTVPDKTRTGMLLKSELLLKGEAEPGSADRPRAIRRVARSPQVPRLPKNETSSQPAARCLEWNVFSQGKELKPDISSPFQTGKGQSCLICHDILSTNHMPSCRGLYPVADNGKPFTRYPIDTVWFPGGQLSQLKPLLGKK